MGSPQWSQGLNHLLKGLAFHAETTLKLPIGKGLRYRVVHHQDNEILFLPDVSLFLIR